MASQPNGGSQNEDLAKSPCVSKPKMNKNHLDDFGIFWGYHFGKPPNG